MNLHQTQYESLVYHATSITDATLRTMCLNAISHPAFFRGYGSAKNGPHKHHNYEGGLVTHTLEVLEIALGMANTQHLTVNNDVLIASALWHDHMKYRDYDENGDPTLYRARIRHLSGSYAEFSRKAAYHNLDIDLTDEIGRCILAHHGRQEWGSPVEPQTVEAQILHFADMLSMGFGNMKRSIHGT